MKPYLIMLLALPMLQGQEAKPAEIGWDMLFQIQEVQGGKVVNSRAHHALLAPQGKASIRAGNRLRYASGFQDGKPVSWNLMDVGTNIDCGVHRQIGERAELNISVDISAPSGEPASDSQPNPRQVRWSGLATVSPGKPTIVFYSDDPLTKSRLQLEVTATPIR